MRLIIASSILLSSLFLPAAASASTSTNDATAPTPRVSTGVIAPTLVQSIQLILPADYPQDIIPVNAQMGLTLMVDENGHPQNIQVVKGINPFLDARVSEAVSKFHFHAGSIDGKAIPVAVNLTVNITR